MTSRTKNVIKDILGAAGFSASLITILVVLLFISLVFDEIRK